MHIQYRRLEPDEVAKIGDIDHSEQIFVNELGAKRYMMSTQPTMFKTSEGQARYFAAYDAALALWPVPVESFDVPTHFGSTHVHVCGPIDAPPLVLLPGQAISSTMWYPNIEALSQDHRVYALDIIGDMGKSVRERPFTQPTDFADWMNELLDALKIEQADVVGISYGGFIALRLAMASPDRVRKLVLMAPANLLRLRKRFFLRMMSAILLAARLSPESMQKLFLGFYSPEAEPVVKQMTTKTDFRYQMYLPPVCTDEELRQIKSPTLLLLGDHEVIYDSTDAFARATNLIPDIQTKLVPNAGHALNLNQPEVVNEHILTFLNEDVGE